MTRTTYGWEVDGHDLIVGGVTLRELAERYGTPLYVYNGEILRERAETLGRVFPDFRLFYSLKANPAPALCKVLSNLNFGADVSSVREMKIALEAGYDASALGFVGPAKPLEALRAACETGIGTLYVESEAELIALRRLSLEWGRSIPVALRINTRHRPSSAGELMAGGPSQFGIDEEHVGTVLEGIDRAAIEIVGIHAFVASQVMDIDALLRHFERVAGLAQRLAATHDFELKLVNFGGGFGVPYSASERSLDLEKLGRRVWGHLPADWRSTPTPPKMYLEVGRYLVAEAGVFLTRVVDVKESRGTTFVITESGISGFARSAMSWAQQHPCSIVGKLGKRTTEPCKVVGPSCMPGDVLCESAELPAPKPGEIVAIHNAGAYGFSMSMVAWGGFPPPKEVLYDQGAFTPIRSCMGPNRKSSAASTRREKAATRGTR